MSEQPRDLARKFVLERAWGVGAVVFLVVAVGALFLIRPWQGDGPEAAEVKRALESRRLDEARTLIDRWVSARPGDGEPLYYRARLEVMQDRPAEAMATMREAVARGYPLDRVEVLRGVLQARAGQFEAAEPVLRRALESGAEPIAEIAEGLARIYLATFRLPEAAHVLKVWMEADGDDARPYLLRNQIDERIGAEPAILVRNYRSALERDPALNSARLGLAQVLLKSKELDEAETEFAAYLARNPKSVEAHNGAGEIALLRGNLPDAASHFNEAILGNPEDVSALQNLALIDFRTGKFTSARDRFRKAVALSPFDTELRYNFARALKMAGDEAQAAEEVATTERLRKEQDKIDELRQSLIKRPDDAELRSEAARWLIEHGHDKEGLEWTELILRQKPGHPPTCRLLAEYHTKKGNFGLANYYRTAISDPRPGARP